MKKIAIAACFVLFAASSLPAFSEDGASLYASRGCVGCHGAEGNVPLVPTYPKIGGQNREYVINQLNDFKSGKRMNGMAAVMVGMVAALTDEDIQSLATYLSTNSQEK